MRHVITLGLSAVASLVVTAVQADTLHKESFEDCTGVGYSLLSGAFNGNDQDGILCGAQTGPREFSFTFGKEVTGYDGNDYIGLEDLVGFGMTNPNAVVLSNINIAGYGNLGINFLFAAPSTNDGRYEANDYLEVQYQVDGGDWVTVGRFFGAAPGAEGMYHDANLNNVGTTLVTNAMQRFTYALNNRAGQGTVTGSTLSVRIMFSSNGAHEEMAFDDIVVTGTLLAPTMNLSATTYSVNENGTPSGAAVVVLRSGSTAGATSVNLSLTSGTATGGGVDFDSSTILVAFADGETSKTISLPIIDDSIDEGNETFTLSLASSGSSAVLGTTTSATVTILDDDTAGVTISSPSVDVSEDGTTDSYTVVLTSQPTSNVEVDITSSSSELELSTSGSAAASSVQLLFTPSNWNVPQTVTVSAVDDLDVESSPHSDALTHVVGSQDPNYDGILVEDVVASILDNDVCGDGVCNPTEDSASCAADCTVCGDGLITGGEVCDGANLAGSTCIHRGFDYGTLACNNDCSAFDTSGCALNTCGDGVLLGLEQCDDGVNNSNTAPNACRTNCVPAHCGDGVIDNGEACDGAALGGSTCVSLGFTSGTLSCSVSCILDVSQCDLELPESDAGADGDAGSADAGTDSDFADDTSSDAPSDTGENSLATSETTAVSSAPTQPGGGATSENDSTSPVPSTSGGVLDPSGDLTSTDLTSIAGPATSGVVTSDEISTFDSGETSFDITVTNVTTPANSNSDEPGSRSETQPPPVATPIFDAGIDGGADAGDRAGAGSSDGCDCRVGARGASPRGWLGLLLTGLIVARLSQRREGRTSVK
jgi:hypothetical protein